jgi:hypothetical protein
MSRRSSSISSSERRRYLRWRAVLATLGWTALALAAIDVAVQFAFPMPASPRVTPGSLAQYFAYGLSIEAKLKRMVAPTDAGSAPIVLAGWIDRECHQLPPPVPPGKTGVTVYGMSFSNHIAQQLRELDPQLSISTYAGPGAPPNHSYACFKAVSALGRDPDHFQVLGVLASSLPKLLTLTGLTTTFESPAPFTYPRYFVEAGQLRLIEPIIRQPADLRDAAKFAAFTLQLAKYDAFYSAWLMQSTWLDHSTMVNLARRGIAQAREKKLTRALVNDGKDFVGNPEIGLVLNGMLKDFIQIVRARGQVPIVVLFQDRGSGTDSLFRLVGEASLQQGGIVVSSNTLASVNDPRNFIADGHFTPAVDRKIAMKVHEAMASELRR